MAVYKKVPGHETVNISTLEFDETPTPGSLNPVTSGGVAEAVGKNEQDMKDMEEMFLVNLPCAANTFRFEFSKMDYDPTVAGVGSGGTWKNLNAKFHNVWDWTRSDTSFANAFESAFQDSDNLVSIIAAGDTSSVTNLSYAFAYCSSIVSICLFDTSNVSSLQHAFRGVSCETLPNFNFAKATAIGSFLRGCGKLKEIPVFNFAIVSGCSYAFYQARKVESGSKAAYDALISQTTPPSVFSDCFGYCGDQTTTGAAELAQIPASWGGRAAG